MNPRSKPIFFCRMPNILEFPKTTQESTSTIDGKGTVFIRKRNFAVVFWGLGKLVERFNDGVNDKMRTANGKYIKNN